MGNNQSHNWTNVVVHNGTGKRIRVRVDCSRSYLKFIAVNSSAMSKVEISKGPKCSIAMNANYSAEFEAYYIVDTSTSYTIVENKCETVFHPHGDQTDFAFVTIWRGNDDGSWTVYCENHPIMRKSEIYAGANIYVKQLNYAVDEEYKAGRIVVYNNSSKKIWVRVDADWIAQTKQSASYSLETSLGIPGIVEVSGNVSGSVQMEKVVYYRANQRQGYTHVHNTGDELNFTTFHLNVPDRLSAKLINITSTAIGTFYLSIDYETSDGTLATHCTNHSQHYLLEVGISWVPFTPYIYVTDNGKGIQFESRRKRPFYVGGGY